MSSSTRERLGTPPRSHEPPPRTHAHTLAHPPAPSPLRSYIKYSDEVYALNANTLEWTRLRRRGDTPAPRAYHSTVRMGNHLLLLGGWTGKCEGASEVHTLDLDGLGSWSTARVPGQAPSGVYGHSATALGHNLVVFGGWDGVSPLGAVHVLDTSVLGTEL